MKILILTDGIYPFSLGGMQKHSYYLCNFLHKNGHKVYLAHCVDERSEIPSDSEIQKFLEIEPDMVYSTNFPGGLKFPGHYLFKSYKYSKNLSLHYMENFRKFDLIYSQGFTAWHLLRKTPLNKRSPVIVNLHGLEMYQNAFSFSERLKQQLLRIPAGFLIRNADYLQSLGGKLTGLLQAKSGTAKTLVCSIGIESEWVIPKISKNNRKMRNLLFIGRSEHRKGLHILTPVIKKLLNRLNFEFDFIGPVKEEERLISERLKYHGKLSDEKSIISVIDQCDILVVPSLSEGMPTVILEAMARGLAIIATDVGAVSELVGMENGFLIEAGNELGLEEAIVRILTLNNSELEIMKENSLSKIANFTWEKVIARQIEQFNKILETS